MTAEEFAAARQLLAELKVGRHLRQERAAEETVAAKLARSIGGRDGTR